MQVRLARLAAARTHSRMITQPDPGVVAENLTAEILVQPGSMRITSARAVVTDARVTAGHLVAERRHEDVAQAHYF
jgi:hypothetical protein